jgi:hypothetical protein
MLTSQAIDTAIGLALMFFIIATAASAITETIATLFHKRATDLEKGISALLAGDPPEGDAAKTILDDFKKTSVWKSAEQSSANSFLRLRRARPAYLSGKAFADAIMEMVLDEQHGDDALGNLTNLRKRLRALALNGEATLLEVKSGLESWFDDSMARLEGAYKRWATLCLFLVGLALSVALNAPSTTVAQKLWTDPVTRSAVAAAASKVLAEGADPGQLTSVADAADKLTQLSLPIGWQPEDGPRLWQNGLLTGHLWMTILGWLLTALFVMMGAPSWFDLLSKLVSLRASGQKPEVATKDDGSATSALVAASTAQGSQGIQPPARSFNQPIKTVSVSLMRTLGLPPDGQGNTV